MFTVAQIENLHKKVKSGADFPNYIREIKEIGVTGFETWVNDSHTLYFGDDSFQAASEAKYDKLSISAKSNAEKFCNYLKMHQNGETDYLAFCGHCAETGVEKWMVDLGLMTCTYYDLAGNEMLVEPIPG